jgi:predicted metal-dependent HD superfamily phosphohydrolase
MLLEDVESYIIDLLSGNLPADNYYHNLSHTKRVVALVTALAKEENCNENEILLVQLAAWFHDVGFIHQNEGHEEVSKRIAYDYLKSKDFNENDINTVLRLIEVTKLGVLPNDILECIIKDADCGHVILDDYLDIAEKLKTEISCKKGTTIETLDWLNQNKDFLQKQRFFTNYAKRNWQSLKENNQFKLQQKIEKLSSKNEKKNASNIGRGVETLFRVQLKNHIELSAIADTKANILLSVNAIIISVALSNLVPKLDSPSNLFLVVPTLILMTFSVASVVLSVMSTRPKISTTKVTPEMIKNKQTNILFFGNFRKMNLEEFEWGIQYLIENEEVLYNSLTKDLYYLGLVLERKYRLLRITYTVFMIGIIISALAFVTSYHLTVSL